MEDDPADSHLVQYSQFFLRVLRASLGNVEVSATVFQSSRSLPVRLVAFHLDSMGREDVVLEKISSDLLLKRLNEFATELMSNAPSAGVLYQRVAMVYSSVRLAGRAVPTVFILKPDQLRYWTRSAALRDADGVVADALMSAHFSTADRDGESHVAQ